MSSHWIVRTIEDGTWITSKKVIILAGRLNSFIKPWKWGIIQSKVSLIIFNNCDSVFRPVKIKFFKSINTNVSVYIIERAKPLAKERKSKFTWIISKSCNAQREILEIPNNIDEQKPKIGWVIPLCKTSIISKQG